MLTFIPVPTSEFDEVFALLKAGLHDVIDDVFGWNDAFQRQRLQDDYQWSWMHWVVEHGQKKALVCFKPYDQALHLHLILVYPEFQRQGLGQRIMADIQTMAFSERRDITLSAFKKNTGAVSLYRTLGYALEQEEAHFLLFRLPYQQHDQ